VLNDPVTSITDFILGLESLILAVLLLIRPRSSPSLPYWIVTILCTGIGTLLGGIYHGLDHPFSYGVIYLLIAVLMTTFCLAVLSDNFGQQLVARLRLPLAGLALLFLLIAHIYPEKILTFSAILAIILVVALGLYLRRAVIGALPGAWLIAAGIGTLLAGTVMMLGNVGFSLLWSFDRNAVYHLVLMISLLLLYLGVSLRNPVPPQ